MKIVDARVILFIALLASIILKIGALYREQEDVVLAATEDTTKCSDDQSVNGQQFYFAPTESCKNCSDLGQMFDNYGKWLEYQLKGSETTTSTTINVDDQSSSVRSSSYNNNDSSSISRSREKSNLGGDNRTLDVKEVSIFKSSPSSSSSSSSNVANNGIGSSSSNGNGIGIGSGVNSYYNSDVVDVALSRLINLENNRGSQDQDDYDLDSNLIGAGGGSTRHSSQEASSQSAEAAAGYPDYSSSSSLSSSSSSSPFSNIVSNSDSSLDFIRGQTKQVTKYVSKFIRYQPVIGDELLEVIQECKHNQNGSACQKWSNLCVMTMYSYSDIPLSSSSSSSKKADHYSNDRNNNNNNNNNQKQLSSASSSNNYHQRERLSQQSQSDTGLEAEGETRRKGLEANGHKQHKKNISWQHCKQFTINSICNSLRDWHRSERKSIGIDNALQSIYATIDEPFNNPIGATNDDGVSGGSLPVPGLVLRVNQPLQLLAYRYNFDGALIGVNQFGPNEMERFCLRSNRLMATNNLRQFKPKPEMFLRVQSKQTPRNSGYFRFGKNMKLTGCHVSELEAFQLVQEEQLNDTQFIDLYIAYQSGNSMMIKPVPILLKNLLYNGNLINQKYSKDSSRWRLVHRFFYHSLIVTTLPNMNSADQQQQQQETGSESGTDQRQQSSDGTNNQRQQQQQQQLNLLYAKSVVLDLKFRKLDKGALLSSILLTIDYGIVSRSFDELASSFGSSSSSSSTTKQQNKSTMMPSSSLSPPLIDNYLDTSLIVEQSLIDMQAFKRDLDLAITILSILSSIWSLIKCYNIQKCCGNVKLDLESIVRFVIIGCDTVAFLLLAVLFIFITYLFVLLKLQQKSVQVLAPTEQLESSLLLNLQLAFIFKLIGLIHKLYIRLNADIFFIDWERPRMLTSSQILNLSYQQHQQQNSIKQQDCGQPSIISHHHHQNQNQNQQQLQQQQVSFWRPYTVINRWFQMQTLRRLDLTVQLILFVLIIHLTNVTRLASADLSLDFAPTANEFDDNNSDTTTTIERLTSYQSLIFRAIILSYIYIVLAIGQILYKKYFHESMLKDSVREFVDLCSVANVSLFCWLYPRFGYYIHGRNANGSGDRGIGEMNALLEREERDLCSKRGLAPNSDQQTFILILPKVINDHYRSLLSKEPTSFASKLSSAASNQLLGKQLFNSTTDSQQQHNTTTTIANNNGQSMGNDNLLRSTLNLSSSASLSGIGSPPTFGLVAPPFSCRSHIDSLMAKHKSIQQFLTNFLEHVYKDIDYVIREGRRFENLLLLDFDFDDEALISMPLPPAQSSIGGSRIGGARSPTMQQSTTPQPLLISQQQQQQQQLRHQAAIFCKDKQNSFSSLLWFGLEFDLVLVELLSFLVLDYWLGQAPPLITASLVWFIHHTFKAIYISCSRYNLITKALVDEKFLFSN